MRSLFLMILLWVTPAVAAPQIDTLSFRLADATLKVRVFSAPSNTPAPLIMISHGWGANERSHTGLARDLVSAGFVVAAVRHAHDLARVGEKGYLLLRPMELSAALTTVLNSPKLAPHIDASRIGAFGYSMGGYTVLATAGATYDPARKAKHCRANVAKDAYYCSGEQGGRSFSPLVRFKKSQYTMPIVKPRPPKDPRIRAIALAAPVGVPFSDFSKVDVPVLLYRANRDGVLKHPFHATYIHNNLKRRHTYVELKDMKHLGFLSFTGANSPLLSAIHAQIAAFFKDAL